LLKSTQKSEYQPLALKLINTSGGKYSYSSDSGENRLIISLPFTPIGKPIAKKDAVPTKISELAKDMKKKKDLKELNILLVEDNPINQKITFLTLKPLVKSIDTASNGKEALDKMATADFDIILMDILMPVMDGLVAAEKIRALEKSTGKHIPIIAITANAMLGDKEKCLSAGIDDYISKPFQPANLIEKIRVFF
jgi:CheY-like chemotaxis protein